MTDLPGAGAALDEEDDRLLVLAGARTSSMIALKATCCSSRSMKAGSLWIISATWSSRRLCGRKAVSATRSRIEPSSGPPTRWSRKVAKASDLVAGEGRVRRRGGSRSPRGTAATSGRAARVQVGAGIERDRRRP